MRKFFFGDVEIKVPEYYIADIENLAWIWGHTELAEKLLDNEEYIDINHEELIQLMEILYSIIR